MIDVKVNCILYDEILTRCKGLMREFILVLLGAQALFWLLVGRVASSLRIRWFAITSDSLPKSGERQKDGTFCLAR